MLVNFYRISTDNMKRVNNQINVETDSTASSRNQGKDVKYFGLRLRQQSQFLTLHFMQENDFLIRN